LSTIWDTILFSLIQSQVVSKYDKEMHPIGELRATLGGGYTKILNVVKLNRSTMS
jgi:hypothetical protein